MPAQALPRSSVAPPPGSLASVNTAMQALASAGGANTGDGAVTSLDVSSTQDMLVAGFYSGRVVLFDLSAASKVAVLKATELHRAPVSVVRFVSATEPGVMSVRRDPNYRSIFYGEVLHSHYFWLHCRSMLLVLCILALFRRPF